MAHAPSRHKRTSASASLGVSFSEAIQFSIASLISELRQTFRSFTPARLLETALRCVTSGSVDL
jgi:hypothetical protein